MSKKLIMIIFSLFILVFFSGCNNTKIEVQSKSGLKIYNWSSALGGVNENDLDKIKYSYSLNLTNEEEKNIFIKSVQPLVNEEIKNKVLSKEIVVDVNQNLRPNESIKINGEIIIDTKGLGKSDILTLKPFITDIKVLTEETVSLKSQIVKKILYIGEID
ncbi:hypothetical protein JOC70_003629 [Clostridium pascui]|uniref:hypothetical protein n=1 Tax=Clostridium pascui TaxID=46609 RepID=UPI00195E0460|nr:hypothetical protein [Clostridium pascui]MBM7872081.1 hypothetical protein [Clostridium pascui]